MGVQCYLTGASNRSCSNVTLLEHCVTTYPLPFKIVNVVKAEDCSPTGLK